MSKKSSQEWKNKISVSVKNTWEPRVLNKEARKKLSDAAKKGNKNRIYKKKEFHELKSWRSKKLILFADRGYKCEKCGWAKKRKDGYVPVEVDAKDGNHNNPNKDNFEILCPNCHSLTDNYMFYGRKHTD